MKLKLPIIYIFFFFLTCTSTADGLVEGSRGSFYVKGNVLVPFHTVVNHPFHNQNSNTPFATVAIGYSTNQFARKMIIALELEGFYREQHMKVKYNTIDLRTEVEAYGGFANIIATHKDFRALKTQPFIGAGIGYGRTKSYPVISNLPITPLLGGTSDNFIYQIILGTSYNITSNFSIHADMRYMHFAKIIEKRNTALLNSGDDFESKISNFTLGLGVSLSYRF